MAVRIVELSDDPWILANVGVGVFEDLLHRDAPYFIDRLSADARWLPRLRRSLAHIGAHRLDKAARTRLGELSHP